MTRMALYIYVIVGILLAAVAAIPFFAFVIPLFRAGSPSSVAAGVFFSNVLVLGPAAVTVFLRTIIDRFFAG